MARTHGRLFCSIWDDDEFLALSPYAKLAYSYLVSQDDLTHAGTIIMRTPLWAEEIGISEEAANAALDELHHEKFVVMDRRRFELLVRALVRRDGVYKQPNVYKSAIESMRVVSSRPIRAALAVELARLDDARMNAEIQKLHSEIIDWLRRNSDGPAPKGSGKGFGNPVCPKSASDVPNESMSDSPDEAMSENRYESMIAERPVDNYESAGQDTDSKGSVKGSEKGTPARAFSTYHSPLPKEQEPADALFDTGVMAEPASDCAADKPRRERKTAKPKEPKPSKHVVADALLEGFWNMHGKGQAQSWISLRGIIRTAISNGLDRDDVARALDRLAREGSPISGGTIQTALKQINIARDQANGTNVVQLPAQRPSTTDARVAQAKAAGQRFAAAFRAAQQANAQGAV